MSVQSLGSLSTGSIVKILEFSTLRDYIVLKHGYPQDGNGLTLLMKKHLTLGGYFNSGSDGNEYKDSNADYCESETLLHTYLDKDIPNMMPVIKIPYSTGNGSYNITTLRRQAFLLSGTEVGLSDVNMNVEGSAITYFNSASARIAYNENSPTTPQKWWLRSPCKLDSNRAYCVNIDGTITDSAINTTCYYRPAFVLPSSLLVNEDGTLLKCSITHLYGFGTESQISKIFLRVLGYIPPDALFKVEVTNNSYDETPTWEDATESVLSGRNYVFQNKLAAGPIGFNYRITVCRGKSGTPGWINKITISCE